MSDGLFAFALENEIEGVVRGSLRAAVATLRADQARARGDFEAAEAIEEAAEAERAASEKAWETSAWASAQLDEEHRRALRAARMDAVNELRKEVRDDADVLMILTHLTRAWTA